ncbi:MAG: hypothetical protein IT324_32655 [Anaerolineae bacterium]|nr:hypothetical protein [Anaerolineae bacterium]
MKLNNPSLAFALIFAASAAALAFVGERNQNVYFLIAAASLTVATYVTYPPLWMMELAKLLKGQSRR